MSLLDLDFNANNVLSRLEDQGKRLAKLERYASTGANKDAFLGRNNPPPGLFQADGNVARIGLRDTANPDYLNDPDSYAINVYGNRVGINTKYPSTKVLHIAGDLNESPVVRLQYSNDAVPLIRSDWYPSTTRTYLNSYSDSESVYKPLMLRSSIIEIMTGATTSVYGIYINAAGLVGIATATPAKNLHVAGLTGQGGVLRVQYSNDAIASLRSDLFVSSSKTVLNSYKDTATAQYKPLEIDAESFEVQVATTGSLATMLKLSTAGLLNLGSGTGAADGGLTPKLFVENPSDNTKWVGIGYDNSGDYGFIFAVDNATAWKNLLLNPFGGDVASEILTNYSATSTVVGWSSFTTKKIFYSRLGKLVHVQFELQGTSNATTISFTLPNSCNASSRLVNGNALIEDNGVYADVRGYAAMPVGSTTVTVYRNISATAFTNSGEKFCAGEFFYWMA